MPGNTYDQLETLVWKDSPIDFETLVLCDTEVPSEAEEVKVTKGNGTTHFGSGIPVAQQFSPIKCLVAPIVTSSTYLMDDHEAPPVGARRADHTKRYQYSRYANPTRDVAEELYAKLEGAKYGLLFGSGTAAVASVIQLLGQGDHAITSKVTYSGSLDLFKGLPRVGASADFVQTTNVEEYLQLIKPNTKLIFLEALGNPTLILTDVADLVQKIRKVKKDIIIVVDNTFLTPIFLRPLDLGADIVIHSCSKFLGGHGDLILGALATNSPILGKELRDIQRGRGGIPSPFDCYLLIRSLKTLPLRMAQIHKNGLRIAKFLKGHPQVEKVIYPALESHPQHALALKQLSGLSGVVGFYVKGGLSAAAKFLDEVKVVQRASSLGSDCTLASIPAKVSHDTLSEKERIDLGILDNYIRLSLGIEGTQSLIADLDTALRTTKDL